MINALGRIGHALRVQFDRYTRIAAPSRGLPLVPSTTTAISDLSRIQRDFEFEEGGPRFARLGDDGLHFVGDVLDVVVREAALEQAEQLVVDGFVAGEEIEAVGPEEKRQARDGAAEDEARESSTHDGIPRSHFFYFFKFFLKQKKIT